MGENESEPIGQDWRRTERVKAEADRTRKAEVNRMSDSGVTVGDVYAFLDEWAPFSAAESYDNVGLLLGSPDAAVSGILVSLDCTRRAVARAAEAGANLIVSHHPVIFEPLRRMEYPSAVADAVAAGVSVISSHTNLDLSPGGVSDALCHAVGLSDVGATESGLRVGFTEERSPAGFAALVGTVLGCRVRYTEGKSPVRKVAVCPGAGGSFLREAREAGCDALLTGEAKYSAYTEAADLGMTLVGAGHYETERPILPVLRDKLASAFPGVAVEVFCDNPTLIA